MLNSQAPAVSHMIKPLTFWQEDLTKLIRCNNLSMTTITRIWFCHYYRKYPSITRMWFCYYCHCGFMACGMLQIFYTLAMLFSIELLPHSLSKTRCLETFRVFVVRSFKIVETEHRKVSLYSRTSLARTPLEP